MRDARSLPLQGREEAFTLFGPFDRNLKAVRRAFHVDVYARGGELHLTGPTSAVEQALAALRIMLEKVRKDGRLAPEEVDRLLPHRDAADSGGHDGAPGHGRTRGAETTAPGQARVFTREMPKAKTPGQQRYVDAMESHEIVFAIGPAGTGKTYLAVAQAVQLLRAGSVRKIVLTRPAVEAGEKLGFLPGDYQAKVNPYLRPLYDALEAMMDFGQVKKLTDTEIIEVAPLAYMRGRTLEHAFIILDEAQNTTPEQMKMFLTRMGVYSRIVVTGDITQVDLPLGTSSGLIQVQNLLKDVRGLSFCNLTQKDIVRHPLVQRIVDAYEIHEKAKALKAAGVVSEPVREGGGGTLPSDPARPGPA